MINHQLTPTTTVKVSPYLTMAPGTAAGSIGWAYRARRRPSPFCRARATSQRSRATTTTTTNITRVGRPRQPCRRKCTRRVWRSRSLPRYQPLRPRIQVKFALFCLVLVEVRTIFWRYIMTNNITKRIFALYRLRLDFFDPDTSCRTKKGSAFFYLLLSRYLKKNFQLELFIQNFVCFLNSNHIKKLTLLLTYNN